MSGEDSGRPTCLIVLGMHRSGTSALVRVASLLGYTLPATLLGGKATSNPKGHWESLAINRLNDDILALAGLKWRSLEPIGTAWSQESGGAAMRTRAFETLAQEYGDAPFFVLKDPRLSLLLPFWLSVLDDYGAQIRIVSLTRDPTECAASLEVRNGLGLPFGELLWLRYVLDGERASRSIRRAHVSYDQLLASWRDTAATMHRDGNVAFPVPQEAAAAAIDTFLSPDERHHRVEPNQSRAGWVQTVAEIMARWADKGEDPADHATLDAIRAAFDASFDQLGEALQVGTEGTLRANKSQALRSAANRALKDAKLVQHTQTKQLKELSARHAADQALLDDARETAKATTFTNAALAAEIATRRRDLLRAHRDARRLLVERERTFAAEQARNEALAAEQAVRLARLEDALRSARDAADRARDRIVARDARIRDLDAAVGTQDVRLTHAEAAAGAAQDRAEAAERRLADVIVRADAAQMLQQRLETRDRDCAALTAEVARLGEVLAASVAEGAALRQRLILLEEARHEAEQRLAAAHVAAEVRARIDDVRHAQAVARHQAAVHERDSALTARRSLWPFRREPTATADTPDLAFDGDRALIAASNLFDPAWYLACYPDVAAAGLDPVRHYLASGAAEGRDPGPSFSSSGYLRLAPDVAARSLNPLLHYLHSGIFEGRQAPTPADEQRERDRAEIAASPLFDAGWYREIYTDLPAAADAAADYLDRGIAGTRDPGPLFSSAAYLAASPDVAATNGNPLLHYLRYGQAEGRSAITRADYRYERDIADIRADPWFDEAWYRATYPEVAEAGGDAAVHFLAAGAGGAFDPGPAFSSAAYLDAAPDVQVTGNNPLLHYRRNGAGEGRFATDRAGWTRIVAIRLIANSALFDAAWYCTRYPDIARAGADPAAHYLDNGWREGRDPGPAFSTVCYLDAMAEAGRERSNPLFHYLTHGQHEGWPIVPALTNEMLALVDAVAAHPLFKPGWYAKRNAGALPARHVAAHHYVALGAGRRRNPGPGFRVDWYDARYPDVAQQHVPAFLHFVRWGKAEGREPLPPPAATDDIRLPAPARSAGEGLSGDRGTAGILPFDTVDGTIVDAAPSAGLCKVLQALHDHRAEGPSADEIRQVARLSGGLLTDLWFAHGTTLRLRIDMPPAAAAVCTAFVLGNGNPVACGRRTIVKGVPCLVDATLPDGLQPMVLVIQDAQGHLLDELLIPFPSLARGGLHEAEAVAALLATADTSESPAALSDRMLLRWLAHRGDNAAVRQLHIMAGNANGTERVFEEATRHWLATSMRVDVTVGHAGGSGRLMAIGAATAARAAAPPRRGTGTVLTIGADCVPTIGALIAPADDVQAGAGARVLLADPAGGRSVRCLTVDDAGDAAGIDSFVNPSLRRDGDAAPVGLTAPLAIAFRRSDTSPASLLFRTPADRAPREEDDALADVTVLLDGTRPPDRATAALRNQTGGDLLTLVAVDPEGAGAAIATRWVLLASAEVLLPDPDTIATLVRIARAGDIASVGCLEVRQAGKGVTGSIGGWIAIADAHGRLHPGRLPFEAVAGEAENVTINTPAFVLIPTDLWQAYFTDRTPWSIEAWLHFTAETRRQGLRHVTTDRVSVAVAAAPPPVLASLPGEARLMDLAS